MARSGIAPDTGSQVATQFFNRAAYAYIGSETATSASVATTRLVLERGDLRPLGLLRRGRGQRFRDVRSAESRCAHERDPDFCAADNSVSYTLPAGLGGVYGQAMVAAGEGNDSMKYTGARLGFAVDKLNVGPVCARRSAAGPHQGLQHWRLL